MLEKCKLFYGHQIGSQTFAIDWRHCECCTSWHWHTFPRSRILILNIHDYAITRVFRDIHWDIPKSCQDIPVRHRLQGLLTFCHFWRLWLAAPKQACLAHCIETNGTRRIWNKCNLIDIWFIDWKRWELGNNDQIRLLYRLIFDLLIENGES